MNKRELLQKQTREGFRRALRDPKTRAAAAKLINQGKDFIISLENGQQIKMTILGQHGEVIYRK
jgi:hypothetical protein